MAAGLLWALTSAVVHSLAQDSALDALMWPTHKHVGVLMALAAALRLLWALLNASRRPPALSWPARLGHWALYALMLAVPVIGMLRQHGSGRAFSPLGLPLFQGRADGSRVQWAMDLGNQWHGELGWALLALIAGHVFMAFWHRRDAAQNVLPRMW